MLKFLTMNLFGSPDIFQLALQVAVSIMEKLKSKNSTISDQTVRHFLADCLGQASSGELSWICDCLSTALKDYAEVDSGRRFLRMPLTLARENFVTELRKGPALRALRRIYTLCRLQRFIEDCLDDILAGKCSTGSLPANCYDIVSNNYSQLQSLVMKSWEREVVNPVT